MRLSFLTHPQHICQGSEVGKAKGSLRSDPVGGQHLECPCMVSTEGCRLCYILNMTCLGKVLAELGH